MARYDDLRRDPATKELFNKRITTIEALVSSLEGSSFIAIDTEHVAASSPQDRVLHQVGLVYMPTLLSPPSTPLDTYPSTFHRPCLQDFFYQHNAQALTLNIALNKQDHDRLVLHRGDKGIPRRRASRVGLEKAVPVEAVEETILDFVQSLPAEKPLVLLGFELAAEWTYLSRVFPGAMGFISAWVDVSDIVKDIASSVGYSTFPSLSSLLTGFGYSRREYLSPSKDENHSGNAHNAVEDAVATCAVGHALLFQDNQNTLIFYQKCSKIARPRTKNSRFQKPSHYEGFSAAVRIQRPFSHIFKTGSRLAGHFLDYSPIRAGLMSDNTAFLTFSTKDEMDYFIKATNGHSLPKGETMAVEAYLQPNEDVEREMEIRKSKRQLREAKRLSESDALAYEIW